MPYARFREIDGRHEFRAAVPNGYVDYQARRRRGGRVAYFNFPLAKEMGLIPRAHRHELTRDLHAVLIETFGLQIINEYDLLHGTAVPPAEILPHPFMATRYLQLQHPDRRGRTSGDGRSIWNGQLRTRGVTWDIMSCGTGATRLSPATAIERRFFRTGDGRASYGCGLADLTDAFCTAVNSAIFHANGIDTERTLAILEYPGSTAIVVRAGRNLLRPSHFFHHLKQGNLPALRSAVDYFVERQLQNGTWQPPPRGMTRYEFLAEQMARIFARLVARFECEYIFCWLDWDGDNILADGGIVDYGSVRQFGLFHHEYRYDDDARMSTTIDEQAARARDLVQTFCQIRDYLRTGSKPGLRQLRQDRVLGLFDRELERTRLLDTLYRIGFTVSEREHLLEHHARRVREFRRHFTYFERAMSSRGVHKSADGITRDAIFCMRDALRELPAFILRHRRNMTPVEFLEVIRSRYARGRDLALGAGRRTRIREFQRAYLHLVECFSGRCARELRVRLRSILRRSRIINRADRITGNAVIHIADEIARGGRGRQASDASAIIESFVAWQRIEPDRTKRTLGGRRASASASTTLRTLAEIVFVDRHGL